LSYQLTKELQRTNQSDYRAILKPHKQDLAVYALDLRGRGKSDGERFYVQQFDNYASDVATFVKIAHGTEDKATKPSGSRRFYDTAGSKDKTLKLYEGHYHDLLNDLGKEEVMGDITAWINDHLPA
jgi:alpha-beta hydrolase superfamily lysophospholipase